MPDDVVQSHRYNNVRQSYRYNDLREFESQIKDIERPCNEDISSPVPCEESESDGSSTPPNLVAIIGGVAGTLIVVVVLVVFVFCNRIAIKQYFKRSRGRKRPMVYVGEVAETKAAGRHASNDVNLYTAVSDDIYADPEDICNKTSATKATKVNGVPPDTKKKDTGVRSLVAVQDNYYELREASTDGEKVNLSQDRESKYINNEALENSHPTDEDNGDDSGNNNSTYENNNEALENSHPTDEDNGDDNGNNNSPYDNNSTLDPTSNNIESAHNNNFTHDVTYDNNAEPA